jgi:hypothetical protein
MKQAACAWDRFWFAPADPTTLGFIRICAGLMVLYIHLCYSYDLEAFCSRHAWFDLATVDMLQHERPYFRQQFDWEVASGSRVETPEDRAYELKWGGKPQSALHVGQYLWSVWFHVSDPRWMWPVHIGILIAMACFTIGFCTRITAVLTWLGVLSYINRAQTTVFGVDTMQNLVVLYLMIGPSGAALSVDRLIKHYWATRRARRLHLPLPEWSRPAPSVSANFAIRLLQINICLIYLVSGLSKLQGNYWWAGNAIWLTMADWEFSPMQYKYYRAILAFLGGHRWLFESVVTPLTIGSVVFEISFIFLVWQRRWRWFMVMLAAIFHLGIAFLMGLVPFSTMMLVMVGSFLPSRTVRDFLGRFAPGETRLRLIPADA